VNSGNEVVTLLAFNYNRNESDLNLADQKELEEFVNKNDHFELLESGLKPLNEIITGKNSGKSLWKWFIVSALLCIIAEVMLLRYFGKRNRSITN
jgi:hypothetical protein